MVAMYLNSTGAPLESGWTGLPKQYRFAMHDTPSPHAQELPIMLPTIERGRSLRFVALVLIGAAVIGLQGHAQAPRTPRPALVDNDRVSIRRLTFAAGQREQMHSNPTDVIVVQATPGEVEFAIGDEKTTAHADPGKVWYVPKQPPHAYSNVGSTPLDIIVIFLK